MAVDLRQLEDALLAADAAGDKEGAALLAEEIQRRRGSPGINAMETPGKTPALSQAQARADLVEGAKSGLEKVGRSGARIVAGAGVIAPLALDAGRYVVDKISGQDPPFARATGPYMEWVRRNFGEPETELGRGAESVGSAAVGGLAGALRSAASASRHMLAGAAGGLGAEVGQAAGEPFGLEDVGALIGGAAGGGAVSLRAASPKLPQLISDSMKGVSDEEFSLALALRNAAREQQIDLTPEQLFEQPTGLSSMVRETVASGKGRGELDTIIRRQPQQVAEALRREGGRLGPGRTAADSTPLPLGPTVLGKGIPEPLKLVRSIVGSEKDTTDDLVKTSRAIQARAQGIEDLANQARKNGDSVTYETYMQDAQRLRAAIPTAFREVWSEEVTKALAPRKGLVNPEAGSQLADRFLKNERSTRELLNQTFAARGFNSKEAGEATEGFMTFLRVLQASGRNRSGFSPGSAGVKSGIGQGLAKTAVQLTQPLAQQSVISRLMTGVNLEARYRKLSDIFASPDGIEQLRQLSRAPVMSAQAAQIVSGILGGATTLPEE